jgi:hypothetical protein
VVGYFSPAVSRALHQLALDTDSSIQALLGEAIDDLMRKHSKHPFGGDETVTREHDNVLTCSHARIPEQIVGFLSFSQQCAPPH